MQQSMINVDTIFLSLRDLSKKDKGGYLSSDEFNRMCPMVEGALFLWYFDQYEKTQSFPEALQPFIVPSVQINVAGGFAPYPANLAHKIEVHALRITPSPGAEPVIEPIMSRYLHALEVGETLRSSIRRPDLSKGKAYHTLLPDGVQVFPYSTPAITLKYLRYPTYAVRGYTLDTVNDEEDYSAGTSSNFEWPDTQRGNLIDLFLLYLGLEIRETELVQWASNRMAYQASAHQKQ